MSVEQDGDRRAQLVALGEVRRERVAYRGEPVVAVALDVRHGLSPRLGAMHHTDWSDWREAAVHPVPSAG